MYALKKKVNKVIFFKLNVVSYCVLVFCYFIHNQVHLRINSVEESLQKKINNLEQQLTTKTNHFEQRIQEMVCVSNFYFMFSPVHCCIFFYTGGPEPNSKRKEESKRTE